MTFLSWLFRPKHYEIKIALFTLLVLLTLPVISVVVLASSGIAAAGETLTNLNPVTRIIEILDPEGNKVAEVKLQTIWPTKGYVSDEFGTNGNFRKKLGLGAHTGIDIANEFGAPGEAVTPFMPGKVIKVNPVDDNTCGIYVKVEHDNGISSLYCHLLVAKALEMQPVKPGDIIGLMGSSGASTGAHLHFQVMVYDIPVNPRIFMVGQPERSTVRAILPNF